MGSCKLCASLVIRTKLEYNDALAKVHAQVYFRQLRIFDEEITFEEILEKCFPNGGYSETRLHTNSSKYQSLVQLCRSLFSEKAPNKSRRVLCKKCTSEKAVYTSHMIIDHACSHLRLDLYECRKCARQFSTKTAITTHLANSHRLNSSVAHFNTRLDDFYGEISTMIKECFSEDQIDSNTNSFPSAPRVFTGVKLSDLGSQRQTYCQLLIRKFCDRKGNVQCRLCAKGIKTKNKDGFTSSNLLGHVFRHLQKPIIRCKICSDGCSNGSILVPHLRKVHALPLANNYERQEDQFHDDIMAMLRKCYSNEMTNEAIVDETSTNIFKSEASAICNTTRGSKLKIERRMYCYGLCRKLIDRQGKIECHLCAKRIGAKDAKDCVRSDNILRHALTHLNHSSLNRCKICSKTFLTNSCTAQHLRVTHALPLANNYEDLSDQFHHEILDVVRKCYDARTNVESASSRTSEPKIRNPVKGSKLAIERQAVCVRIIKKYLDSDGRINCRLCSNRIAATKRSGCYLTPAVTSHALTHTQRNFYRCKLCSNEFVTRPNMCQHLRTAHRKTNTDDSKYECLEDQFHSEIVDTFRKCYGNEAEVGPE